MIFVIQKSARAAKAAPLSMVASSHAHQAWVEQSLRQSLVAGGNDQDESSRVNHYQSVVDRPHD